MKQKQTFARPALGLLLAAAALPFTPSFAQDATTPVQPPVVDVSPPPIATPPPEEAPVADTTPAPAPTVTTPVPTVSTRPTIAPAPSVPEATREPTRTTRTVTRARSPAPARSTAPVRDTAPSAAAPAGPVPLAATPPADAPAAAAPVETLPVETIPPAADTPPAPDTSTATWPWLALGAVLLLGAIALFARRRRRVDDAVYEDRAYVEPVGETRVEPAPLVAPALATPMAFAADEPAEAPRDVISDEPALGGFARGETFDEPAIDRPAVEAGLASVAGAAAVGAASGAESGEPHLEFAMRPVRAGVGEEDARVDFELGVANTGTAAARDVRVSAWMLGAGAPRGSEAEHALIEHKDIGVGDDANVEGSVALPRSGLSEDAILPVVVAEARYRRPDGSEGRATASYAVGVPDGDEMAWFDVENPSGLHEGVEARALDEVEGA